MNHTIWAAALLAALTARAAGGVTLSDFSVAPKEVDAGGAVRLGYRVCHPSGGFVGLGASARKGLFSAELVDLGNDAIVWAPRGCAWLYRDFRFPARAEGGAYDTAWGLWRGTPGASEWLGGSGWRAGLVAVIEPRETRVDLELSPAAPGEGDAVVARAALLDAAGRRLSSSLIGDPRFRISFHLDGVLQGTPEIPWLFGRAEQPLGRVPAGAHVLRAEFAGLRDGYTKHLPSKASLSFTVTPPPDGVPPAAKITAPANGAAGDFREASGEARDDREVQKVEISLDGSVFVPAEIQGAGTRYASWRYRFNASLVPGRHTLRARAFDGRNWSSPAETGFSIPYPALETWFSRTPPERTLNRNAEFAAACSPAPCYLQWALDGGPWGGTSAATGITFHGLSEGRHTVQVRAWKDGRTDPTPAVFYWDIEREPSQPVPPPDTAKPAIASFEVTPKEAAFGGRFNISYCLSDGGGSGLARAELRRAPDAGGASGGFSQIDSNAHSGDGPTCGSFTDAPPAGVWWYELHALDNAGNRASAPPQGPRRVLEPSPAACALRWHSATREIVRPQAPPSPTQVKDPAPHRQIRVSGELMGDGKSKPDTDLSLSFPLSQFLALTQAVSARTDSEGKFTAAINLVESRDLEFSVNAAGCQPFEAPLALPLDLSSLPGPENSKELVAYPWIISSDTESCAPAAGGGLACAPLISDKWFSDLEVKRIDPWGDPDRLKAESLLATVELPEQGSVIRAYEPDAERKIPAMLGALVFRLRFKAGVIRDRSAVADPAPARTYEQLAADIENRSLRSVDNAAFRAGRDAEAVRIDPWNLIPQLIVKINYAVVEATRWSAMPEGELGHAKGRAKVAGAVSAAVLEWYAESSEANRNREGLMEIAPIPEKSSGGPPVFSAARVEAVVDTAGGKIAASDLAVLTVPPRALVRPTLIGVQSTAPTVTQERAAGERGLAVRSAYELSPPIEYQIPAALCFEAEPGDRGEISYWNETAGAWERLETRRAGASACADIGHQSVYALLAPPLQAGLIGNITVAPAVFKPNDGDPGNGTPDSGIEIRNAPAGAHIEAFDLNGTRVWRAEPDGTGFARWDAARHASGLYTVLVREPAGGTRSFKVLVIR